MDDLDDLDRDLSEVWNIFALTCKRVPSGCAVRLGAGADCSEAREESSSNEDEAGCCRWRCCCHLPPRRVPKEPFYGTTPLIVYVLNSCGEGLRGAGIREGEEGIDSLGAGGGVPNVFLETGKFTGEGTEPLL